jgi:hypothetical protein
MLASTKNKFIFFHLYKVAGTSVRGSLKNHTDLSYHKPHIMPSEFINTNFNGLNGKKMFNEYKTIAFVRNPWDWQVSLYHYMLRDKGHFQYKIIKDMDFKQYLNWRVNEDLQHQYRWLSEDFTLEGNINVDFIGRFEHLSNDFNFIMNEVGLDVSLPHLNKTPHKNYKDYYDENTKNMIYEYFKQDIEYFGYNFDNQNIQSGEEIFKNKQLV